MSVFAGETYCLKSLHRGERLVSLGEKIPVLHGFPKFESRSGIRKLFITAYVQGEGGYYVAPLIDQDILTLGKHLGLFL